MEFRFAEPNELPEIIMLMNDAGDYQEIDEEIAGSGGRWFSGWEGGVLAAAIWVLTDVVTGKHVCIDYLAIHEEWQDLGVAFQLLFRLSLHLNTERVKYYHGMVVDENGDFLRFGPTGLVPVPEVENATQPFYQIGSFEYDRRRDIEVHKHLQEYKDTMWEN